MKQNAVPIDQAGRIVLPKSVRQELAIKSGDTFTVAIHGMTVTLTPNNSGGGFVRKGKALVFATDGDDTLSVEEAQAVLESGRADHHSRNLAGLGGESHRG
jgi:AbrB family looped-hinge helix DNA binding protein